MSRDAEQQSADLVTTKPQNQATLPGVQPPRGCFLTANVGVMQEIQQTTALQVASKLDINPGMLRLTTSAYKFYTMLYT